VLLHCPNTFNKEQMRKTNFNNIGVRGNTKKELDKLKKRLSEEYISGATYDDLIRIFLQKNKKIVLSKEELSLLILKPNGVRWN